MSSSGSTRDEQEDIAPRVMEMLEIYSICSLIM